MTETFLAPLRETRQQDDISLWPVDINAVPELARNAFLESAGLDEETAHSIGLDSLGALQHSNGDTSYIGIVPGETDEGFVQGENTFVIDTDTHGSVTGIGEIRFFQEFRGMPGMVGRPFVGYTLTTGPRRHGLGTRRLLTMNAIAHHTYGQPLHSGTHIEPEAQPLWDRLVSEGRAIRLPDGAEFQYSFA